MSKLYLDVRTPDLHPPTVHSLPDADAPLALFDRASLRLGLWLLLRSARNARRHADHALHARRVDHERDRFVRESAALRLHQLAPRPWWCDSSSESHHPTPLITGLPTKEPS